jgi:hypothetical protein
VTSQRYVTCSARGGHFSKGLAGYNIGNVRQFLKRYLQCLLAARIFTVDFVVRTLAVKKKIRARFDMSDRTIPFLVKLWAIEWMQWWKNIRIQRFYNYKGTQDLRPVVYRDSDPLGMSKNQIFRFVNERKDAVPYVSTSRIITYFIFMSCQ